MAKNIFDNVPANNQRNPIELIQDGKTKQITGYNLSFEIQVNLFSIYKPHASITKVQMLVEDCQHTYTYKHEEFTYLLKGKY
jgi:hypothetical protein